MNMHWPTSLKEGRIGKRSRYEKANCFLMGPKKDAHAFQEQNTERAELQACPGGFRVTDLQGPGRQHKGVE